MSYWWITTHKNHHESSMKITFRTFWFQPGLHTPIRPGSTSALQRTGGARDAARSAHCRRALSVFWRCLCWRKSWSKHVFLIFFWDMSSVIFWTSDSKICVLLVWILENTSENERFDLQQWRLKFEVTKMESGIEARQLGLKQHIDYWPIVNCMNKIGSKPTCFRCLPIIHPQIRQFVQDLPSFIC